MKNYYKFTIAMEDTNIKIKLDLAENVDVELDKMSITALESFLKVTNALKNIAATVSENVIFSIEKGSAAAVVHGSKYEIQTIYGKIDEAIEGKSDDGIITKNLRDIQNEIKNDVLQYQFFYSNIKLEERIKNATKIKKKSKYKSYRNEFRILTGKFNEVGGQTINYHLEYPGGGQETIDCTISEALELKDFLFQNISCLVKKKIADNDIVKPTFIHCAFLATDQISRFRSFIDLLQEKDDIIDRLDIIYDFFDSSPSVIADMATMLKASINLFDDINELKTLLIISKGMKDNEHIKGIRNSVLSNFELQMNKM